MVRSWRVALLGVVVACTSAKVASPDRDGPSAAPCVSTAHCSPLATCFREAGVDLCLCPMGYEDPLGDGSQCVDLDECAASPERCTHGGVCANDGGGFHCDCTPGFVDRSGVCVNVDECATGADACDVSATCVDTVGAYECVCPPGYVDTDADGSCDGCEAGYLETAAGQCTPAPIDCSVLGVCAPGGACIDSPQADVCSCSVGYEGHVCGRCSAGYQDRDRDTTCEPRCETAGLSCNAHQVCDDSSGTATCVCLRGYTGAACATCASEFADVLGTGSCLPVTCEAALKTCPSHATCYDADYPPTCRCDVGFAGVNCSQCAPTHVADGSGGCAPSADLDPSRFFYVAGVDDLGRPTLAAADRATFELTPIVQLTRTVRDLTGDSTGRLWALSTNGSYEVLSINRLTGSVSTFTTLTGYHGLDGLAVDAARDRLYVGASIGAGDYLVTVDLVSRAVVGSGGVSRIAGANELAFTLDPTADKVRGVEAYVSSGGSMSAAKLFEHGVTGAGGVSGATVDLEPSLASPGLARMGDDLVLSGRRAATDTEWLHEACRAAVRAVGPGMQLPAAGVFLHDGLAVGSTTVLSSGVSGPTLHTHGSYDDGDGTPGILRIETTHPSDVVCVLTYEETLDIVVSAAAKFKLLYVASYQPTPRLVVETGFSPPAGAAQPVIWAWANPGPPHGSFSGPNVRVLGVAERSALKLPPPYYDPMIGATDVLGTVDWTTGAASVHDLEGWEASGGVAAAPCCPELPATRFCDAAGRVALNVGACDAASSCAATVVVHDDCTDRAKHPVVQLCGNDSVLERTPACVLSAQDVAYCGYTEASIEACDGPGSCVLNGSVLEHTSPESCGTSGGVSCRATSSTCADRAPECSGGQRSTFATQCAPETGCYNPATTTACPSAPSTCESGTLLEHVRHPPTCADATSCVASPEVRTTCALQMCVGNNWVTYGTPTCDPATGCGGNQTATQNCTIGTTQNCVDYTHIERTTCSCVPGVGCQCSSVVEVCPDRDNQCVGTSGKTLRVYQPRCEASTDTCTWNAPDTSCPNFCQVRAGDDVCY